MTNASALSEKKPPLRAYCSNVHTVPPPNLGPETFEKFGVSGLAGSLDLQTQVL